MDLYQKKKKIRGSCNMNIKVWGRLVGRSRFLNTMIKPLIVSNLTRGTSKWVIYIIKAENFKSFRPPLPGSSLNIIILTFVDKKLRVGHFAIKSVGSGSRGRNQIYLA